jgi:hypothetical protein
MAFDFQRVVLNEGELYSGTTPDQSDYPAAARGNRNAPEKENQGLPVQGNLETEMSTPVYRSEDDGHSAPHLSNQEALLFARVRQLQDELRQARGHFNVQHPVDEYVSSPGVPGNNTGYSNGNVNYAFSVEVTRTWDMPERIEGVFGCLPVGCTQAVIKLADRYFTVYQGNAPVPSQPAVPPSGVGQQNPNAFPVTVVISGGTATVTVVNGLTVGPGDGTYVVPAYGSIAVTYSVAPTWVWSNAQSAALLTPLLFSLPSPVGCILNQDDDRLLLMNGVLTQGPTHFELTGYAHELYGNA